MSLEYAVALPCLLLRTWEERLERARIRLQNGVQPLPTRTPGPPELEDWSPLPRATTCVVLLPQQPETRTTTARTPYVLNHGVLTWLCVSANLVAVFEVTSCIVLTNLSLYALYSILLTKPLKQGDVCHSSPRLLNCPFQVRS